MQEYAKSPIKAIAMTGDYYEYNDEAQQLIGRDSGKVYSLGDSIRVILMECEPETGSLLFKPAPIKLKTSSKKKH
jgi:exoribonuclease R